MKRKLNARRGLALVLSLVLCLGMLQLPVLAHEAESAPVEVTAPAEVPEVSVEEPAETPEVSTDTPEEPAETPEEPAETPEEPAETPEEPAETPEEPAETPEEPAVTPEEPAVTPEEPAETPEEPAETPEEPAETPEEPAVTPEEPAADVATGVKDVLTELLGNRFQEVMPVPEEVQTFLDAVAAIPTITPDNAAEAAEYLYGEVYAAYDALLGTGYEDRADVQEAVAVMTAAAEAVEEALELAAANFADVPVKTDNVTKTAYSQFNPNTNTSNTVSGGFAENGLGTVVLDDKNPTATDVAFCHYWGAHIAGFPNGFQMIAIEKNTNPSVATATARSTENGLVVEFKKGTGTGTTTIVVGFTVTTLRPTANIASSGQTYAGFSGYLYYTVTNNGTGTDTKPAQPTVNDVPTKNQNGYVYVKCVTYPNANPLYNSTRKHAGFMSLKNSTEGWSFGEVYANDGRFGSDAPAKDYPWCCDLTVNKEWYLDRWNANYSKNEGIHYLDDEDEVVKLTFVSDGSEWYYFTDMVPLIVWITHEAPVTTSYTVVHQYYDANGQLVGEQKELVNDVRVGKVISAADLTQKPEYEGETYEYKGADPKSLTVSADPGENIITLRYEKAQTYTVIYTDGVKDEIVFPDQGYEGLEEGEETPKFVDDDDKEIEPERDGYTFMGWTPAVAPQVDPDMADDECVITYTATWLKENDGDNNVNYTVQWILRDGETDAVAEEVNRTGKDGDDVSVTQADKEKTFEGYTFKADISKLSGKLMKDAAEKLLLKLIYVKDTETPGPGPGPGPGNPDDKTEYTVTYQWTDLPEPNGETLPTEPNHKAGDEVTVDTTYAKGTEVIVGDKTYVFSGWSTSDAEVVDGKFTMPAENVVIQGTWTEKPETPGPGPGPENPDDKTEYTVTYQWTGLPDGHSETLPTEPNHKAGDNVTVDTEYTEGTEVTVGDKTYVFSGWDKSDFTMPAENVVIQGTWTEKPETPGPGPGPGNPTDPEKVTLTLSYDANDGSNPPASQSETVNKGDSATFSVKGQESMTRDGYTFQGWATSSNGNVVYSSGSSIAIAQDTTLYAVWSRNTTPDPDPDDDDDDDYVPPTPVTPGEPPATITDEEPPLAELPEEPLVETPDVSIPEEEVPLIEIPEEEVPLAEAPRTGDNTWLLGALTFLSAMGLALLGLTGKKRNADEE